MKLYVIAVGNKMPAWISAGFAEYARRMPREARVELIEVKPERRGAESGERRIEQILASECARISAAVPQGCLLVALDQRGETLSTLQLAARLQRWMESGRDLAFIIGSADGLSAELKKDALLSLSALTLPHGLVRVILAEQLYRAVSILYRHPYHRE